MNKILKSFYHGQNKIEFIHRGAVPEDYKKQINKIMQAKGRDDWLHEWDVERPDDIIILIIMADCIAAFSVYRIIKFPWQDVELTVVATEETASTNGMCLRMILIGYKQVFEYILRLSEQKLYWLSLIENPIILKFINRIIVPEKIWHKSLPWFSPINPANVENEIALHYINKFYVKNTAPSRHTIGLNHKLMETINEIIVVEISHEILTDFGNDMTR